MPAFQEFDTEEEALAYIEKQKKAPKTPYGRAAIESIYPGIHVTDDVRPVGSKMYKKNPKSTHASGDRTVDVRPMKGMDFEQFLQGINDAGYDVVSYRDEVKNPSAWATGPHWHVEIGDKHEKIPEFDTEEEALAYMEAQKNPSAAPIPVSTPVKNKPIDQNAPSVIRSEDSGTLASDRTAITDAEKAQQDDIQSLIFNNAKTRSWEDISSEIGKRYPDQLKAEGVDLRWYYDHYRQGGKTGINWTADKNRTGEATATPDQEITVEGNPANAYGLGAGLNAQATAYKAAAQRGFPGLAAREIQGLLNPDLSREEIAQAQRDLREELDAQAANYRADGVGGFLQTLPAEMLGGAGPEYLLPGAVGETAAARLASAAGINAATDALYQGADIAAGVQDEFSPEQNLMSVAAGTAFQGLAEGLGRLAREHGTTVQTDSGGREYVSVPTPEGPVKVYDPSVPINKKAQLLAGASRPSLQPPPGVILPKGEWNTKTGLDNRISELTSTWVDAPEFVTYSKFSDLPDQQKIAIMEDTDGRPEEVKAFVDQDGRVHAIGEHLEGPEDVTALTFHEGLGHFGLRKLFGARLDAVLEAAYRTNPSLQQEVDDWFASGGRVPDSVDSPTGRATEEVLAERSEAGPIDAKLMDRLKNVIKDMARRMGWKNLAYSDREVNTILGMAHSRVLNGGGTFTGASGNAYIRRVTHVSPHDFTNTSPEHPYGEFDHSKMGSGEGAQVYGWGTYLGENTRDSYFQKFSRMVSQDLPADFKIEGKYPEVWIRDNVPTTMKPETFISDLSDNPFKEDWEGFTDYFNTRLENLNEILAERTSENRPVITVKRRIEETIAEKAFAEKLINSLPNRPRSPKTYEVDIHPHQEERMMLWDKPLSEQPEKVKAAWERLGFNTDDYTPAEREHLKQKWLKASDDVADAFEEKVVPLMKANRDYRERVFKETYDNAIALGRKKTEAEYDAYEAEATARAELDRDPEYRAAQKEVDQLRRIEHAAEQAYSSSLSMKAEDAYKTMAKQEMLKSGKRGKLDDFYEAVSKKLLAEGVIGNKYEDGFSRGKNGEKSYNFVVFDEKEARIVNKYMRKKSAKGVVKKSEVDAEKYAGNINLDNIDDSNAVSAVIRTVAQDIPRTKYTREDIEAAADELGMSQREVRDYVQQNGAARLLAMRKILVRSGERVMEVVRAIDAGDNSDITLSLFAKRMAAHRAIQEKVSGAIADAGRALNAMKIVAKAQEDNLGTLRYMSEKTGAEILGSRKGLQELARKIVEHADNPKAKTQLMKDAFKPLPEDYIIAFRYNMMLYGLGTHVKNVVGNASMMGTDFIEHGLASVFGQLRRGNLRTPFASTDRVTAREVLARGQGFIQALSSAGTYREAGESFKKGTPTHSVSKVEVGKTIFSDKIGKAGLGFELPTRALSAEDSFFRSLIEQSNINGLAHRLASTEGMKGKAYWDRVDELITEPTAGMKAMADESAAILQLVDEPSVIGKQAENMKRTGKNLTGGQRVFRFAAHMIAPFSRVADRILFAAIRRIPIVGFLDKVNRADFAAGGARRDMVYARMTMGALMISYLLSKYSAGELSGDGGSNFDRKMQKQASGWRPNSIKIGDEWVSTAGLDTTVPLASLVVHLGETLRDPEFSELDIGTQVAEVLGASANAFADNTFVEQLASFTAGFGKSSMAENARENYAANFAKSFVPAASRQATELADGYVRDASGTGTLGSKVAEGLKASMPGLREELPIRHDVYGNPVESDKNLFSFLQSHTESNDPVIKEVERLSDIEGKALVTSPDRGDVKKSFGIENASSDFIQAYTELAGKYTYESLKEHMSSEEWGTLSDEEKVKLIKKIGSAMKKYAREDLVESTPDA